ncbi:MAG: hypothetical protein VX899_13485 [Myxococcota bacterium]|nr:hypothetical protein [Myxococcota bacterium]
MFLFLLSSPAAAQHCTALSSELARSLEDAEAAFEARDKAQVLASRDQAVLTVNCMVEPITRSSAARLHRVMGLAAFLEKDQEAAQRSFAAARRLEPAYTFPTSMVPEGHPVREDYRALAVETLSAHTLVPPLSGHLTLDGHEGLDRPDGIPTVYQRFNDAGAVVDTRLLRATDPDPDDYAIGALPGLDQVNRDSHWVLRAGFGLGVGPHLRTVDQAIQVDANGTPVAGAQWDGLQSTQAGALEGSVGLRSMDILEISLSAAVFNAQQEQILRYEILDEDGGSLADYGRLDPDPRLTLQAQLEPRASVYLPLEGGAYYGFAGAALLYTPGITVDDTHPWQDRSAHTTWGVQAGFGALWTLNERVGVWTTVPFTLWLGGTTIKERFSSEIVYGPTSGSPAQSSYRVAGGLEIRL